MSKYYLVIGLLSVVFVVVILAIFGSAGNPFDQRAKSQDNIRSQRVQSLSQSVSSYANTNQKLPVALNEVEIYGNGEMLNDPETKKPFEYKINSATKFVICADFARDSTKDDKRHNPNIDLYKSPGNDNPFLHGQGNYCLNFEASSWAVLPPAPAPVQPGEGKLISGEVTCNCGDGSVSVVCGEITCSSSSEIDGACKSVCDNKGGLKSTSCQQNVPTCNQGGR